MRGLPREPAPCDVDGETLAIERRATPVHIVAEPVVAPVELPPAASAKRWNVYVKNEDVEKYCETVGCPGCVAVASRRTQAQSLL